MNETSASFAEAIRRALAESDSIDMRAVATRVVHGLPPEMMMEAATTHLSSMARRYYNQQLRETGADGPAEELVSLRGVDVRLVDTEEGDRDWLARNREILAEGLRNSADRIRDLRGHIVGVENQPDLAARDVMRAERRAEQLTFAARTLEHLLSDDTTEVDDRVRKAQSKIARHEAEAERYAELAGRILRGWKASVLTLSKWTRTVNAVQDLEAVL